MCLLLYLGQVDGAADKTYLFFNRSLASFVLSALLPLSGMKELVSDMYRTLQKGTALFTRSFHQTFRSLSGLQVALAVQKTDTTKLTEQLSGL